MNLIEISNMFNTIARAATGIESYHMGWPSDRVRNVSNNFDDADIGQYFPRVLFWPPAESTMDVIKFQDQIEVRLFFDDLLGYDNVGDIDINTQLEKWNTLRDLAFRFVREVNKKGHDLIKTSQDGLRILDNTIRYTLDAPGGQQRIVSVMVQFTLVTTLECQEFSIDYDNLPSGWTWPPSSAADLENTLD